MKPGGGSKTVSRWDIQQVCSRGMPREQHAALARRAAPSGRTRPPRPARRGRRARARAAACRSRCPAPARPARAGPRSSGGAPVAYTDAGPPERMIPRGLRARDLLERHVVRQQLAEDAAVAHAPRDQLRVLPAVVEHERPPRSGARGRCAGERRGAARRRGGSTVARPQRRARRGRTADRCVSH